MSNSPVRRLQYENSGSSNDVDYSPIAEAQAGPSFGPTGVRSERQSISKRPYRQRRKDPSCDACRDRKVKCDASDAGACSECYTRGVPCCFTKESNRRMSSMKQIQDLEERLSRAKQEIIQLRMSLAQRQAHHGNNISRLVQGSSLASQQEVGGVSDGAVPSTFKDDSTALLASVSWRRPTACVYAEELPPQHLTLQLLDSYEQTVHPHMPIVLLQDVQHEVDKLFQHGKLDGVPQAWRGMLMAMLACAVQSTGLIIPGFDQDHFIHLSIASIDQSWSGPLSSNHVRLALLLASYFFEDNLHTAGGLWYRTACALAGQIGCDPKHSASTAEAQSKQALVISIGWFRVGLVALQQNSSTPIDYLSLAEFMSSGALDLTASNVQSADMPNLDIIQALLRIVPPTLFSSDTVTADVASLRSFEVGIALIVGTHPAALDAASTVALTQQDIVPAFAVQMVRMLVILQHFEGITSGHALIAAEDTARLLLRIPDTSAWSHEPQLMCSSLICLHLWRCQMILCLYRRLESAKVLWRLSTAINTRKKINKDCTLSLAYWLDQLIKSLQAGADPATDDRLLSLLKDSLGSHVSRASTAYQLSPRRMDPTSLRRDSSDDTVFSEMKEDVPVEDEWTLIDKKFAQLEELYSARASPVKRLGESLSPTLPASQSSRSRMQISNIIK